MFGKPNVTRELNLMQLCKLKKYQNAFIGMVQFKLFDVFNERSSLENSIVNKTSL